MWALAQKELRNAMLADRGTPALIGFMAISVVVPMLYGWYIGMIAGVGIAAALLFFRFLRTQITVGGYDRLLEMCAHMSMLPFGVAICEKLAAPWDRATGGFYNPNYYGMALEFLILICLYRVIYPPQGHRRISDVLLLGMNLAGLVLCDCQSAVPAVFVSVFLLLLLSRRRRLVVLFCTATLGAGMGILTNPDLLPRLEQLPERLWIRSDIWLASMHGITEHPLLGQGALSYYFRYASLGGYEAYHAHNIYLDVIQNFGIVGTLLLLVSFVPAARAMVRSLRLPETRPTAVLALCAAAAVLVHGLTDVTILWMQNAVLFFLLAAGGSRIQAGEADSIFSTIEPKTLDSLPVK